MLFTTKRCVQTTYTNLETRRKFTGEMCWVLYRNCRNCC